MLCPSHAQPLEFPFITPELGKIVSMVIIFSPLHVSWKTPCHQNIQKPWVNCRRTSPASWVRKSAVSAPPSSKHKVTNLNFQTLLLPDNCYAFKDLQPLYRRTWMVLKNWRPYPYYVKPITLVYMCWSAGYRVIVRVAFLIVVGDENVVPETLGKKSLRVHEEQ